MKINEGHWHHLTHSTTKVVMGKTKNRLIKLHWRPRGNKRSVGSSQNKMAGWYQRVPGRKVAPDYTDQSCMKRNDRNDWYDLICFLRLEERISISICFLFCYIDNNIVIDNWTNNSKGGIALKKINISKLKNNFF